MLKFFLPHLFLCAISLNSVGSDFIDQTAETISRYTNQSKICNLKKVPNPKQEGWKFHYFEEKDCASWPKSKTKERDQPASRCVETRNLANSQDLTWDTASDEVRSSQPNEREKIVTSAAHPLLDEFDDEADVQAAKIKNKMNFDFICGT